MADSTVHTVRYKGSGSDAAARREKKIKNLGVSLHWQYFFWIKMASKPPAVSIPYATTMDVVRKSYYIPQTVLSLAINFGINFGLAWCVKLPLPFFPLS